jgi:hypothetical protein
LYQQSQLNDQDEFQIILLVVLDASFGKFDVSHSIMVAHQLTPSY